MPPKKTAKARAEELLVTYQKWSWMWPVPEDEMPDQDVHYSNLKEFLPEKYKDKRVVLVPFLNLAAADVLRSCLYMIQELEDRIEQLEKGKEDKGGAERGLRDEMFRKGIR